MDKQKYYCSKHGKIGSPSCKECWEKLIKLVKDKGGLLLGSEGEMLNNGY